MTSKCEGRSKEGRREEEERVRGGGEEGGKAENYRTNVLNFAIGRRRLGGGQKRRRESGREEVRFSSLPRQS